MAFQVTLRFIVVICFTFLVQVSLAEHNIRQCADPTQAAHILCQKDIKDGAKFLQIIKEVVDCPESGINTYPITCILVTNQLGDDGGDAEIVSGGIGYTSVEISMTSKLSKGLDYHMEIYTAQE
ncbi:uncharacterized protein LOC109534183 [Dendroctonus ponderosae]